MRQKTIIREEVDKDLNYTTENEGGDPGGIDDWEIKMYLTIINSFSRLRI